MKILVSSQGDAASYYRVQCPFGVLNYRTDIEVIVRHLPQVGLRAHEEFDALWLHMNADSFSEIVARGFKSAGKPVIMDVDDWLFDCPPTWPTYDEFFERGTANPKLRLGFHQRLLEMADIITTTTPYLAKKLQYGLGGKSSLGPQIRVLPNAIMQGDYDILDGKKTNLDGPVIGWAGTGNHWDDWSEIAPALDVALEKIGGYLVVIGMPEAVHCFPQRLRARTYTDSLVRINQMRSVREKIGSFDAGLAWATRRLEASNCRSPLKALQYGAAGVPVFASSNVYGEISKRDDGKARFPTFDNPKELGKALVYRINEKKTKAMATAWRDEVFEKFSYERNAMKWLKVLEEVVR